MRELEPGDHVALREVFRGRVWRAIAAIVVRSDSDLLAFWVPEGAEIHIAVNPGGYALINQPDEWTLQERRWENFGALRFAVPGEAWSIWPWGEPGAWTSWYVNLEEPMRPSPFGFDYLDHKLDLLLYPDGTHRWKDEDHLQEAVAMGNLSDGEAEQVRAAGEQVLTRFLAGWRPYEEWRTWRPDPSWGVPSLPQGWRK
jgi:hypothetical protein